MPIASSLLQVVSADAVLVTTLRAILAPFGWNLAYECGRNEMPGAVLLDARDPQAAEAVGAIRKLPPPRNGVPILAFGNPELATIGAGGHLDAPLEEAAFLALLRHWAGPLDDHALRGEPWSPRYRLIRLMGLESADAMLARLAAALGDAVAGAGDGGTVSAHRLAGIAGLCGFAELGGLWSRVDRGEDAALPAALAASRSAAAEIARALAR
jgi:hypothetical protein